MLLGVITLKAEPKYRIETWVRGEQRFYLPQKRIWYRTNYFTLPIKVWVSSDYPFQSRDLAEDIISNWKQQYNETRNIKKSEYIKID